MSKKYRTSESPTPCEKCDKHSYSPSCIVPILKKLCKEYGVYEGTTTDHCKDFKGKEE